MYAFLAFIPILVTIILMTVFNWGAKKSLTYSLGYSSSSRLNSMEY
jgi:L-lactate permease